MINGLPKMNNKKGFIYAVNVQLAYKWLYHLQEVGDKKLICLIWPRDFVLYFKIITSAELHTWRLFVLVKFICFYIFYAL